MIVGSEKKWHIDILLFHDPPEKYSINTSLQWNSIPLGLENYPYYTPRM